MFSGILSPTNVKKHKMNVKVIVVVFINNDKIALLITNLYDTFRNERYLIITIKTR